VFRRTQLETEMSKIKKQMEIFGNAGRMNDLDSMLKQLIPLEQVRE